MFTHGATPLPVVEPFSGVLFPEQIVTSVPAFAVSVPAVTVTASVEEQEPFDAVTVYVVVDGGVQTGFAMFGLLNPVAGNQLYVVPPDALSVVEAPQVTVTSDPAFAVGEGVTVTITVAVEEHEVPLPTVTV